MSLMLSKLKEERLEHISTSKQQVIIILLWIFFISARQHTYAIAHYMLSPVRPSVCLSVCPSHGWISQRRLKLGSCKMMQLPPQS